MSEKEPEAEDGFGENVKDGIGDDLSVDINLAGSVGDTPDAAQHNQYLLD